MKAPLTEREQRIYRAGLREGARLAVAEAAKASAQWLLKLSCGGVASNPPAAFSVAHPMTPATRRKAG